MKISYILIGLALLFLYGCAEENVPVSSLPTLPVDPGPPPMVVPSRKGLYYGYFGTLNDQVEETLDHVNLLFEPAWDGMDAAINRMGRSSLSTVLVISSYVYTGPNWSLYLGKETAQKNLRQLFNTLRDYNVLKNIVGLYPIDEPELGLLTTETITEVNRDIREVMSEYYELKNTKLIVTYTSNETYPGLDSYDIVGFDEYGEHDKIFSPNGKFDRLRNRLREDQMLVVLPGGANPWRTNPTSFYERAQQDTKIWAIIPFIWLDNAGGSTNQGIRSNGTAEWYVVYGRSIKEAK